MGEDAPHEAAVVLVPRVLDGLLLGQGLGQQRGRGHVGQLLRGRGQQIRCRAAHDGPVGLGEAGALERPRHHGSGAGRRRRGLPGEDVHHHQAVLRLPLRVLAKDEVSAVRAVPLEGPSAEAAVTELRPRRAAWTQ